MYLPPRTDPLALSDYGPRGWPHDHADPLRNRCAVGRRLALLASMVNDQRTLLDDLENSAVPFDIDIQALATDVSDHEGRITELES